MRHRISTLCGHPLWLGRVKPRVAKKYLHRYDIGRFLQPDVYPKFKDLKVGDIINDCSSMNGVITEIFPHYWEVVEGGFILTDIDFTTSNTGCSLTHCGIEVGVTQEQVEARYLHFMESWFFGGPGARWYGDLDNPEHKMEIDLARRKYEIVKSGGHIVDERGLLLDEFKPRRGLG